MRTCLRFLALLLLTVAGTLATTAQQEKHTNIDQFPGTDVLSATDIFSEEGARPGSVGNPTSDERKKIFSLYNVGQKKFLVPGGTWGTHAAMGNVGTFIWIEKTTTDGKFNFHTNQTSANDVITDGKTIKGYLQYRPDADKAISSSQTSVVAPGVYTDAERTQGGRGWTLTAVSNASSENIYKLSTVVGGTTYYLTAVPGDAEGNTVKALGTDPGSDANGQWKIICLDDYFELFNLTPSELESPTDATFLIRDASFSVNNRYLTSWTVTGSDGATSGGKRGTVFGLDPMNKCGRTAASSSSPGFLNSLQYNSYIESNFYIQSNYGAYYFAYTDNQFYDGSAVTVYQDVTVDRDGWYIVRCNGFSNANTIDNNGAATSYAFLQATEVKNGSETTNSVTTPLNPITNEEITSKKLKDNNLSNTGKAFANGDYVNQVMIRINNGNHNEDKTTQGGTIRLGFRVNQHTMATDDWTAVDNFRLLYAGDTTAPDLVLDEEDENMDTLSYTTDTYVKATLHLNRKFTLGKWNTIVLPVSLTASQIRDAFGDETQLAYLKNLTAFSMQFEREDLKTNDNVPSLEAYRPYIIKPTKDPGTTQAYKTPKLTATHTDWSSKDLYLNVKANHYIIPMVTFTRGSSSDAGEFGFEGTNGSKVDHSNWELIWASSDAGSQSTPYGNLYIKTHGTLGKTYRQGTKGNGAIIEGRATLAACYFMYGGDMWHVPVNKRYGLKAFRLWFEPRRKSSTTAKLSTFVDDEEIVLHDSESTGIDDITYFTSNETTAKPSLSNGVYTVTGQRVRGGISTGGLPAGMYIVAGKKIMVK